MTEVPLSITGHENKEVCKKTGVWRSGCAVQTCPVLFPLQNVEITYLAFPSSILIVCSWSVNINEVCTFASAVLLSLTKGKLSFRKESSSDNAAEVKRVDSITHQHYRRMYCILYFVVYKICTDIYCAVL